MILDLEDAVPGPQGSAHKFQAQRHLAHWLLILALFCEFSLYVCCQWVQESNKLQRIPTPSHDSEETPDDPEVLSLLYCAHLQELDSHKASSPHAQARGNVLPGA